MATLRSLLTQDALMLDSLEEARQLCAMHGYETGAAQGVPTVMLVKVRPRGRCFPTGNTCGCFLPGKAGSPQSCVQPCPASGLGSKTRTVSSTPLPPQGAYVDPPPPVPRKRSDLISGMAPATRRCSMLLAGTVAAACMYWCWPADAFWFERHSPSAPCLHPFTHPLICSLAVTTPSVPPMTAEEAAALEQQRQQQLQRLREQEAARAQQAAEQQRQHEMAAAAAAAAVERQRQEAEAAR